MKTIEMKIKKYLKIENLRLHISYFILNSTMVKVDIFWVKEKNKVYY